MRLIKLTTNTSPGTMPIVFTEAYATIIAQELGEDGRPVGMAIQEMRKVNRIIDQMEKAQTTQAESMLLEDVHWEYLKERMLAHLFPVASVSFERLVDAVLNAEEAPVPPIPPIAIEG